MTITLATPDRRRLASILGMLGSNSAGERDNAARMAEAFRHQHTLTWTELLALPAAPEIIPEPVKSPPPPQPTPPYADPPGQSVAPPPFWFDLWWFRW